MQVRGSASRFAILPVQKSMCSKSGKVLDRKSQLRRCIADFQIRPKVVLNSYKNLHDFVFTGASPGLSWKFALKVDTTGPEELLLFRSSVYTSKGLKPVTVVSDTNSSSVNVEFETEHEQQPRVVKISAQNELLVLQVQAFLNASEGGDIDGEIIEDLLQLLVTDGDINDQKNLDIGCDVECDSSLYEHDDIPSQKDSENSSKLEVESPWLKQDIKAMIHLLKERGPSAFVGEYVTTRNISIPKLLQALGVELCPELHSRKPKTMLYFLRVAMNHVLLKREKLPQYNTIEDAVQLIRQSQRILVLTGAGISVSCGIPDFRSRDGLYASLGNKGEYELEDPQQMFDIKYFRENPAVFYSFASQIYPSNFAPSPCHRFIKLIEDEGKLLRNYTQNIDTLENRAGVEKVLQCHGSFATASCLQCRRKVPGKEIEADILSQRVPICRVCSVAAVPAMKGKAMKSKRKAKGEWDSDVEDESDGPEYPLGIMKPDITFFGEKLTDDFDRSLAEDRFKVDLLLVIGTSLKVSPVAEILSHLPHSIPQILINKTPVRHINPDVILLGNADDIVTHLCKHLGWHLPSGEELRTTTTTTTNSNVGTLAVPQTNPMKRASEDFDLGMEDKSPLRVGDSHVWLFEGAEGGKWLQQLYQELGIRRHPRSPKDSARPSTPSNSDNGDGRRDSKKPRIF